MSREKKLDECNGDAACILKAIQEDHFPEEWEALSVSAHSSGPVSDLEGIVRFVLDPTHLGPDGTVDMALLVRDACVAGRGCSVERINMHSGGASALDRGSNFVSKTNQERDPVRARRLHSVMWCECSAIRGILGTNGERLAVVCDTAERDNVLHADVVAVRLKDSSTKQAFRIAFFEALSMNAKTNPDP
jgi:hypothetical protein